ncbi:hypothetical protein [Alishewanella longhuensis]
MAKRTALFNLDLCIIFPLDHSHLPAALLLDIFEVLKKHATRAKLLLLHGEV